MTPGAKPEQTNRKKGSQKPMLHVFKLAALLDPKQPPSLQWVFPDTKTAAEAAQVLVKTLKTDVVMFELAPIALPQTKEECQQTTTPPPPVKTDQGKTIPVQWN